jgi:hypothetical protein
MTSEQSLEIGIPWPEPTVYDEPLSKDMLSKVVIAHVCGRMLLGGYRPVSELYDPGFTAATMHYRGRGRAIQVLEPCDNTWLGSLSTEARVAVERTGKLI